LGDERDYAAARPLYEQALAVGEEAGLLVEYGYLHQCHAARDLRTAAELLERAVELDPACEKAHFQLVAAGAALREPERAVGRYEERVAARPDDVRERRFLAQAYLAAHAFERALETVRAGLALAPDDGALIAARGEARAGLGDAEGALADWRLALELEPDDIG